MLYLSITLSLVLLSGFIFLPQFKGVIERHSDGVNFFLTLIATLVGVLLAISITNYEANQQEKQDVIKLLKASQSSVETSLDYSEELVEYYQALDEEEAKRTFFVKNPLPYPDYLDVFVMQSIVSKNLSGTTLSDLNELLINLKRSQQLGPTSYIAMLHVTNSLLELEIRYQNEEIDELELGRQYRAILDKTIITEPPN